MDLLQKRCRPCEGGVPPLSLEQATVFMDQTPGWNISSDYNKIERDLKFKNFKEAIEFINKVAEIAEREGHHPDINLYGYKNVRITLTTHAIGGLSENDFIVAAKINQILNLG